MPSDLPSVLGAGDMRIRAQLWGKLCSYILYVRWQNNTLTKFLMVLDTFFSIKRPFPLTLRWIEPNGGEDGNG